MLAGLPQPGLQGPAQQPCRPAPSCCCPCRRACPEPAARPLDGCAARAAVLDAPVHELPALRPPPSSGEAIPNGTSGKPHRLPSAAGGGEHAPACSSKSCPTSRLPDQRRVRLCRVPQDTGVRVRARSEDHHHHHLQPPAGACGRLPAPRACPGPALPTRPVRLQEVAGNHGVALWGRTEAGFATDPVMVELSLIFVSTRIQVQMDDYPRWCACSAASAVQRPAWPGMGAVRIATLIMAGLPSSRMSQGIRRWPPAALARMCWQASPCTCMAMHARQPSSHLPCGRAETACTAGVTRSRWRPGSRRRAASPPAATG